MSGPYSRQSGATYDNAVISQGPCLGGDVARLQAENARLKIALASVLAGDGGTGQALHGNGAMFSRTAAPPRTQSRSSLAQRQTVMVAETSEVKRVAGAISGQIRDGSPPTVLATGPGSINQVPNHHTLLRLLLIVLSCARQSRQSQSRAPTCSRTTWMLLHRHGLISDSASGDVVFTRCRWCFRKDNIVANVSYIFKNAGIAVCVNHVLLLDDDGFMQSTC